jgi:hypothetical protein
VERGNRVISDALMEKLLALRGTLEHQGIVQLRDGSYRLRYRSVEGDYRVHRSLPLTSDPAVAEATTGSILTLIHPHLRVQQVLIEW